MRPYNRDMNDAQTTDADPQSIQPAPEHALEIAGVLDAILDGRGHYKEKTDALLDRYGASGTDCACLAHRTADSLWSHARQAYNEQAKRCLTLEAVNMAEIFDALFSPLNRHGTREQYMCDDTVLNAHPEWLIKHHHESGGAAFARRSFESLGS